MNNIEKMLVEAVDTFRNELVCHEMADGFKIYEFKDESEYLYYGTLKYATLFLTVNLSKPIHDGTTQCEYNIQLDDIEEQFAIRGTDEQVKALIKNIENDSYIKSENITSISIDPIWYN